MSEETKNWELWRQRNGHVVVVKTLDTDAPDLYRFQSVNCGTQGWFPRGRHSLGEDNHPLDLVKFLGIVRSGDQKPNPSAPCQSAEIERLRTEVERLERQSAQCDAGWKNALRTLAERLTENERLQAENERLRAEGAAAIERLQAEWQTEFTAAQPLRSEIERLQRELQQAEMERIAEANALRVEQAAEIERLQTELKAERADTHRRLTTAHNNHNLHVAGLKAEHRGESAGLQTAIRLILEKLDA